MADAYAPFTSSSDRSPASCKEALLFSYDLACEGTSLEGSSLIIEEIPIRIHCPACGREGRSRFRTMPALRTMRKFGRAG